MLAFFQKSLICVFFLWRSLSETLIWSNWIVWDSPKIRSECRHCARHVRMASCQLTILLQVFPCNHRHHPSAHLCLLTTWMVTCDPVHLTYWIRDQVLDESRCFVVSLKWFASVCVCAFITTEDLLIRFRVYIATKIHGEEVCVVSLSYYCARTHLNCTYTHVWCQYIGLCTHTRMHTWNNPPSTCRWLLLVSGVSKTPTTDWLERNRTCFSSFLW